MNRSKTALIIVKLLGIAALLSIVLITLLLIDGLRTYLRKHLYLKNRDYYKKNAPSLRY